MGFMAPIYEWFEDNSNIWSGMMSVCQKTGLFMDGSIQQIRGDDSQLKDPSTGLWAW